MDAGETVVMEYLSTGSNVPKYFADVRRESQLLDRLQPTQAFTPEEFPSSALSPYKQPPLVPYIIASSMYQHCMHYSGIQPPSGHEISPTKNP
jgi:hypothetical protein